MSFLDRKRRDRSESPDDGRRRRRRSQSPGYSRYGQYDSYDRERDGYQRRQGGYYGNNNMMMMGKMEDPLELDHMITYRQFAEYTRFKHRESRQRGELEDEDIRKRFTAYKDSFMSKTLNSFFDEQKDADWFKEKYHPIHSRPLIEETINRKRELYPDFLTQLNEGKFDDLTFNCPNNGEQPAAAKEQGGGQQGDQDPVDGDMDVVAGVEDVSVVPSLAEPMRSCSLFLKVVPVSIKRQDVIDACKDTEGFLHVLFSDPRTDKKFNRLGWIIFKTGTDLEKAMNELQGKKITEEFSLSLTTHNQQPYRSRSLPSEFSTLERIETDLYNVEKLAAAFDKESGLNEMEGSGYAVVDTRLNEFVFNTPAFADIVSEGVTGAGSAGGHDGKSELENGDGPGEKSLEEIQDEERMKEDEELRGLSSAVEEKDKTDEASPPKLPEESALLRKLKRRLDVLIEYLRRVHWYDYYSGVEASGPEDFIRRAWVYVRRPCTLSSTDPSSTGTPSKYNTKTEFQRLSERLDSRVLLRLSTLPSSENPDMMDGSDPNTTTNTTTSNNSSRAMEELIKIGGKDPETGLDAGLGRYVAKIEAEKFRCTDCSKLFRGEEFVKKHIKTKHPEIVVSINEQVAYFNNYVRDPNRPHYSYTAPNNNNSINGGGPGAGMMGGNPMHGMMPGMMMGMMGGNWSMGMMGMMPMGMMPMGMMPMGMMAGGGRGDYGRDRGGRDYSRGGGGGSRGGGNRNMPVDPRARDPRAQRSYDDLDGAPKGDMAELNYD